MKNLLPQNQDGMKYAKGLIKNIINFFDDRITEYIIDENYNKELKAWIIPIEAIFFVGDNFQETIENSDDFLQLQKMCENKDLGLVYAINNQIVGVDLFCHHSILNFYFLSIIQSLALDCIETEDTGLAPSKTEAVNFFKHVLMSNFEEWIVLDPSALHKGESNIANSNLLFFQNKFVHLTSFPKELNY